MPDVLYEKRESGVAMLTLNRPDSLNALTHPMVAELRRHFEEIDEDSSVRALILTGAGRGFCSGLDLKAARENNPAKPTPSQTVRSGLGSHHRVWNHFATRLTRMRVPVIAALNGAVAGMGLSLALCSDIRLASEKARFHNGFVGLGMGPTEGGISWLLPRLVGMSRALDIILTGRTVDAAEAAEIGLVSATLPAEALLGAAFEKAEMIARNAPTGMWLGKQTVWANVGVADLQTALQLEARGQVLSVFGREGEDPLYERKR
ncbi:MAG TPA: enoyl-CoA hydratase/isomerase family protein [Burkholderiales bacterium]|nr:enoyl-CoA hydratase/isomerase family protein [Burkholderiales bacterium]